MGRIHFVSTDMDLYADEVDQLRRDIEEALKATGRPDDRVIMLRQCTWNGSVEMGKP